MSLPPLPLTLKYWTGAADRQRAVNDLFDRSAEHYDRACDIMSFGSGRAYRRAALQRAGLRAGMRVLDVGTGTGLLAREVAQLAGPAGRVVGLDPSVRMMEAGARQIACSRVQAVGERLPFSACSFDMVTMGYALRHVPDLDQTFDEFRRVLKPGGRVLLLEITKPASPVGIAIARTYFGTIVPWLTRIGTRSADASLLMQFYWDTIAGCVAPAIIVDSLGRAGFSAERTAISGIFSEYLAVAPN